MAFDLGSVIAHIKADVTDFKKGIDQAQKEANGLKDRLSGVGESIASMGKQAALITGVAAGGLAFFLKSSSEEASNFQKSMTSLDIIAGRFGESGSKAQKVAMDLGKELRIGTGAAADGLQNLIKSGLTLEQSSELLKRFSNEAITGKSSSISLSQAVQNLSFAYATNNSALGNLSGVSENFSDITEKGQAVLGKWNGKANAAAGITEQLAGQIKAYEVQLKKQGKTLNANDPDMAKYVGMMQLTNLTLGSAERFTGTLVDKQAQLDQKIVDLKISIGLGLNPILALFVDLISNSGLIEGIKQLGLFIEAVVVSVEDFDAIALKDAFSDEQIALIEQLSNALRGFSEWIQQNQELVIMFLKGLAIGLGALLIIGTITALITAFMNPLTLLVLGIAALYTAWNTNFLGIRDVTLMVWNELNTIFTAYLMPVIQLVRDWIARNWEEIVALTFGAWNTFAGIIQMAIAIIMTAVKVFLAIMVGDYGKAWEAIKQGYDMFFGGFNRFLMGVIDMIRGWGGILVDALVRPFSDAWNKVSDYLAKIKDALDFTKRHSPSVVDIVNRGVDLVNKSLGNLELNSVLTPNLAANAVSSGGQSMATSINLDFNGAIISDEIGARRIGELVGDSIIRKLQTQIKF